MGMNIVREIPHPTKIKEAHPLTQELIDIKAKRDKEIAQIFTGESDKFLLIIGPCSADSEESVLDYITRLRELQEKVKDKIIMIPSDSTQASQEPPATATRECFTSRIRQQCPTSRAELLP